MMPPSAYRNRPQKRRPGRRGLAAWADSALVWTQGVGHPVMLLAGVVAFVVGAVFIVGLGNIVYKWVLSQRPGASTGIEEGLALLPNDGAPSSLAPGASYGEGSGSEEPGGLGSTLLPGGDTGPEATAARGRLLGVVYYRSLDAHRPAKGAGTESSPPQDTEWVTEAEYEATRPEGQPEHTPSAGSVIYVYPATTAGAASPAQGADGSGQPPGVRGDGSSPDPIAEGVVDTRGRYWIDDIAPGQYDVYCYNANHADTGEWVWREVHFGIGWCEPVHSASPWAYRANVQVPAGGEVSVDFRFE